ncbi:hypothetical protein AA0N74_07875 [Chromobacterium vaccinii]|uniref:hypothetical protein n=1 Tax=Chromobacterium vaccinii TaxID=1108595 RepID=UPI0031D1CCD8
MTQGFVFFCHGVVQHHTMRYHTTPHYTTPQPLSDPAVQDYARQFGTWSKRDVGLYEHLFAGSPSGWSIRYRSSGWTLFGPNTDRGPGFVRPFAYALESPSHARAKFEALWPYYRP